MKPRPNTRRQSPIREAIEAIEAMLNISHRIEYCSDINCRACPNTKETLENLRMAKARLEKEEDASAILLELVNSPNAKSNALWDRARKAVGK